MDNPNVKGFKMEIIEALSDMPTPKLKVDRKSCESVREYRHKLYEIKKNRKEVINKNDKINSNK